MAGRGDADAELDLRGTPCPMNLVKLKLRMEELSAGQVLAVVLDEGDAIRNVPRSAKAEGNVILRVTPFAGGFRLLIEKAGEK
jgi:TusA-related sulfurtransferase